MTIRDPATIPGPFTGSFLEPDPALLSSQLDPLDMAGQTLPFSGRPAAVLLALCWRDGCCELLLQRRSEDLEHHASQIGFPGGRQDSGDDDLVATALRESEEELGLTPDLVQVLGLLSPVQVLASGHAVLPVVGRVDPEFSPEPRTSETESCWFSPLADLFTVARPASHPGLRGYEFPLKDALIWGMSARVLEDFFRRLC